MNRLALLAVIPLLAGCNVHSKTDADSDDNVSIRADSNGQIAFDLPIAQGQVKVPGGIMHGDNFDIDGVKLMPGSSITSFNLESHHEKSTVNVGFDAPAAPDQVRAYFLDQFKQKGVEASQSREGIAGRSKDGDPFTIRVNAAGTGSHGTIEVQSTD